MLSPGQLLDSRYRIERHLAEGGMAHVYVAVDERTDARVAVKVMKAHLFGRPEMRARFVAEAKAAAKIASKQVVRVLDVAEDRGAGVAYLVMELLDGETLAARLEKGPLGRDDAMNLLGELARALDAAHAAGLVHRDLKPGNVFLERDGARVSVKVLDFGIARSLDAGQGTATEIGTPAYAAPEQMGALLRKSAAAQGVAIAADVSPATDVWALGLIAYECFTGAAPLEVWGVESATELPMRMLMAAPVASRAAGAAARWLPVGFDAWFARCVEREAGKRFQAAGEAYAALAAAGAGVTVQAGGERERARSVGTSVGVATFVPGRVAAAEPASPPSGATATAVGAATFAPEATLSRSTVASVDDEKRTTPVEGGTRRVLAIGGVVAAAAVAAVAIGLSRGGATGAPALGAAHESGAVAASEPPATAEAPAVTPSAAATVATSSAAATPSPCVPGDPLCGAAPTAVADGSARPASTTSAPSVRMGATSVSGRLPPEVIQRIARQAFGRFRACYEAGLKRTPSLAGRVSVRFVIGRDGKVANAGNGGSDLPDSAVVSCVVREFGGLSFPEPEGGIVTVTYPILFSPGG